jgi:Bacteriophage clamp loader A subunit
MIAGLNDNLEPVKETKRRGRKKSESTVKATGLFDHIKHIRTVQDPDYYKNLSDADRKSFSPFMIFRGLSMNPALVSDMADLFKYFDKIPHEQMYQLLIAGVVPIERASSFYPWVKAKKKPITQTLIDLLSKYFEVSNKEALEYGILLTGTGQGRKILEEFCKDNGLDDKEIQEAMKGSEDE